MGHQQLAIGGQGVNSLSQVMPRPGPCVQTVPSQKMWKGSPLAHAQNLSMKHPVRKSGSEPTAGELGWTG
jgi:hypothetical protein